MHGNFSNPHRLTPLAFATEGPQEMDKYDNKQSKV